MSDPNRATYKVHFDNGKFANRQMRIGAAPEPAPQPALAERRNADHDQPERLPCSPSRSTRSLARTVSTLSTPRRRPITRSTPVRSLRAARGI